MEGFLKLCFSTYQTIFTEKLYLCLICSFRMYINMHEFETFFHLLCFDHHGKIQKKMFTHADSDILPGLVYFINFLEFSLRKLSMVQF